MKLGRFVNDIKENENSFELDTLKFLKIKNKDQYLFFRKAMVESQCIRCPVCPATNENEAYWAAPWKELT
jgi:hypothetical protein